MSENDAGRIDSVPPPLPGDDATLLFDPGEAGKTLSAGELRRRLGLPEGDAIEDYGELRTIGLGGMGAIFSGHEPWLMREVALKILRPAYRWIPERIGAFIREARTTAQISHPNIVPVYRIGVFESSGVYFSMKRIRGETLREIIARLADGDAGARRRYTLRRLLEIFVSACNGVAFAHHRGVIHCDLKPANLMVGDYGEVLVMDWGMAQCRETGDLGGAGVELGGEPAKSNTMGGTPAFMAPELLTGTGEPDPLTDVYSLGGILYSILTWRPSPYPVDLPPEELQKLAAGSSPQPPGKAAHPDRAVPRELEEIALKAMARNRSKRYQSVAELLEDIHNYLDGYPVRAYSPNIVYRTVKLLRRRPLVPLVALAAALTLIGAGLWNGLRERLTAENLLSLAEYNFQDGHAANLSLRQSCRKLASPRLAESDAGNAIRADAARHKARMIDNYDSALELLGRIPDPEVHRSPRIRAMYCDIFRDRLTGELMSRDDRAVRETLAQLRERWPERFADAAAADPALRRMTRRIDDGVGKVVLSAAPRWVKVELRRGEELRTLDLASGAPQTLELASGCWEALFTDASGGTLPTPLFVHPALTVRFKFSPPARLEPGYVYIPAKEKMGFDGTVEVSGAFQISAAEVTVEAYLEFWRGLPPKEKRKYRAVLDASGEPVFLWDENGKLSPSCSPHQPVTGITGGAARAYCRHLSAKLGKKVSLPREWQWRRAARGSDGRKYPWGNEHRPDIGVLAGSAKSSKIAPAAAHFGDVSPYGVVNLAGNVREFALSSAGDRDLVLVLGGSYLLPPHHATVDAAQFRRWCDRGDDIGFRCVIEE